MKRLVATVLVLLVVAVGLDRGGLFLAEQAAGTTLQESQGLETRPEVSIGGFPFLTQVAANRYDEIDVVARGVPAGDGALRIKRLDVTLTGVVTDRSYSRFEVERARADAVIGFDELGRLLGIELSFGGSGAIEASRTFTVLGQDVKPSITVTPRIVDGALAFGEPVVDGVGDSSGALGEAIGAIFATTVSLQGIPFDIDLDDVRVRRDGLHVALSGTDLRYTVEE